MFSPAITDRPRFSGVPVTSPPNQVPPPPLLARNQTVAILGTSQDTAAMQPYFQVIQAVAARLSTLGYNIMTGASPGANYYGNLGALPQRSFGVHVQGWDSAANQRPDGSGPLYRDYAVLSNGAARTALFNRACKVLILTPGGPGTLQEAAVALEAMYYQTPEAPDRIVLLGKTFWKPLCACLRI